MSTIRPAVPAAAFAVALSTALTIPASSQSLTVLHGKVRVGNAICMASHRHTGFAKLNASKRKVVQAAVKNWSSFTALEYGNAWANFRRAQARKMACSRAGGGWSCKVSAQPCRKG